MFSIKFLFNIVFLLCFISLSFSKDLTILTEDSPPAQYQEDGKLKGIVVEIVTEIMERLGVKTKIKIQTWARAYQSALNNSNTLLFSVTRTKKREDLFKWVGPVLTIKWILVAKKGSDIKINDLNDAKFVDRIGAYKGDAREQFLKDKDFKNLYSTTQPYQLPQMLLSNRLNLIVNSNLGLLGQTKKLNISLDAFEVVYNIKKVHLYMAFSKTTEDRIFNQWKKTFNTLQKEGFIEKVYKKWSIHKL